MVTFYPMKDLKGVFLAPSPIKYIGSVPPSWGLTPPPTTTARSPLLTIKLITINFTI